MTKIRLIKTEGPEQDIHFAYLLDEFCDICREGRGNVSTLGLLQERGQQKPEEGPLTDMLQIRCKDCLTTGDEKPSLIKTQFSCFWRGEH